LPEGTNFKLKRFDRFGAGEFPEGKWSRVTSIAVTRCVRLAQQSQNANDKALLLRMAETWLRLAQQAESRDKKPD